MTEDTLEEWERESLEEIKANAGRTDDYREHRVLELIAEVRRLRDGLKQVADGLFRYNMGDYEACARNAARLALRDGLDAPE